MFRGRYDRSLRLNTAWDRGPVCTMQLAAEFGEVLSLYTARSPKRVIEIGSYFGGTLYYWLTLASSGSVVLGIDKPPRAIDRDSWQSWTPSGVGFYFIEGDSHDRRTFEAATRVQPACDWLFIDGDHSYEGAKADFEAYGPLVVDGGVIVLHDILGSAADPAVQVDRLWREICDAGYVTRAVLAGPNQAGGGTGIVYVGAR